MRYDRHTLLATQREKADTIAYFVHDPKKGCDTLYPIDRGCFMPDAASIERFIAVKPDSANWTGQACAVAKRRGTGLKFSLSVADRRCGAIP